MYNETNPEITKELDFIFSISFIPILSTSICANLVAISQATTEINGGGGADSVSNHPGQIG